MKKILAILLSLVCIISITGCTKKEEEEEMLVGGYTNRESPVISNEAAEIVEEATKDELDTYTPVAYVASQVVAGTNHLILCYVSNKDKAEYALITIYENLQGKAELTSVAECNRNDYSNEVNLPADKKWLIPDTVALDDPAEKLFEEVNHHSYTPIAVVGEREEEGTIYCYLCKEKYMVYKLVYVYRDLTGNAKITDEIGLGE